MSSAKSCGRLRMVSCRSVETFPAGEGEKDVLVLAELARQGGDRLLTRWRLLAALDLAQVGGLDAGALGDLAEREGLVGGPFRLALLPDVVAEGVHVWSGYYTVHGWVSRGAVGDGAAFSRGTSEIGPCSAARGHIAGFGGVAKARQSRARNVSPTAGAR